MELRLHFFHVRPSLPHVNNLYKVTTDGHGGTARPHTLDNPQRTNYKHVICHTGSCLPSVRIIVNSN
ncbi:hypothetical protein BC792_10972 [Sphingobacterium allocomposti]|uniref:Uncharacterized protein n=1 Tax=Sphingobacterium allocomposti TaxID=415956 RepID=A0A5S5DL66_9SPHI|nr:hypothetical protein BC792_10972 [Sphingobacterium composti Yoo et al. 2007 non Ten et al. 2007]